MRSEEFERFRRVRQLNHVKGYLAALAIVLAFDPARPWNGVFSASAHHLCLDAQAFWNREVRDKALLYLARGSRPGGPNPRVHLTPGPGSKRPLALEDKDDAPTPIHEQVCYDYNKGKCSEPCPNGRKHVCRACGGRHPVIKCKSKNVSNPKTKKYKQRKGKKDKQKD